jgi:hypothetical protein
MRAMTDVRHRDLRSGFGRIREVQGARTSVNVSGRNFSPSK